MAGYNENPANLPRAKQCQMCKHSLGYSEKVNDLVCKAFPLGIPEEYLWEDEKHNKVHPEQEGQFIFEKSDTWPSL